MPGNIRRVFVEDANGNTTELSPAEVAAYMQGGGGGGINVDQLANGATALSGLMSYYQNNRYRDDEAFARRKLKKANQQFVDALRKLPNGADLAAGFIKTCSAQDDLDRSQDLINRSEDMAILVNSGGAAAKALTDNQTMGGGGGSGISTDELLLGGVALWTGSRLLSDGRRRRFKDDDDQDFDDLGESTVPK